MSGNKIKLSEILKDRRNSENSFSTEHKKTNMTLEDLEKRLSKISQSEAKAQPNQKLSEPLSDKKLDCILNKLSKIKQPPRAEPSKKPKAAEYDKLSYDFLPQDLKVPKTVKTFL